MTVINSALPAGKNLSPSTLTKFLWWLATAEKELLKDSLADSNRYRIIGMTVMSTWLFATASWSFFFSTFLSSYTAAIGLGCFMGWIILTIDRALIKGITSTNKRKLAPLVLRALLAITIGSFMAQPALLFMFDKEIKLQTSLDNEKKKLLKQTELDSLFANQQRELTAHKNQLSTELNKYYAAVIQSRNNFLAETDGSGGSGKIGIKDIALAKKNEYLQIKQEYESASKFLTPAMDSINHSLRMIEHTKKQEADNFIQYLNNGFLTRIESLNNLLQKNRALQYRYYLLLFILILIELCPVLAKTFLPTLVYDEKLHLREKMEIKIAQQNIAHTTQLSTIYNTLSFESNQNAIQQFFSISNGIKTDKINSLCKDWSSDPTQTWDSTWIQVKNEIISCQESGVKDNT